MVVALSADSSVVSVEDDEEEVEKVAAADSVGRRVRVSPRIARGVRGARRGAGADRCRWMSPRARARRRRRLLGVGCTLQT